jgi:hypothetical protein
MALSLKEFTTGFLKLKLPAKALDVAASAGFDHPPISLLDVMSSARPYAPTGVAVDDSKNTDPGLGGGPPIVVFSWRDPANSPASGGTAPNPLRQATSWNLTVMEAGGEPGAPVINTTIPLRNETAGLVQYTYTYIQLNGQYIYQITAYNDYGSTSAATKVWITVPGRVPNITVTYLGSNNLFAVKGSNFTPGGEVKIIAQVGGWASEVNVAANAQGSISAELTCQQPCTQAGGGQLQFQATDLVTGTQSNSPNENCRS